MVGAVFIGDKGKSMDKLDRVFALYRILMTSRYAVPLERILEELRCSKATFYRTLGTLRHRLGVPVAYENRYDGYRVDRTDGESHEFPGLWFTSDEIESLACLDQVVSGIQPGVLDIVLAPVRKRIEGLLEAQGIGREWKRAVRVVPIRSREYRGDILKRCTEGALRKKKLEISYRALSTDTLTSRTVSPQTVLRYRDNWYLDAWCHHREELRTFSVSRIESAEILNKKARCVSPDKLDQHFASAYGIFSGESRAIACVAFTGMAARAVSHEQWHPEQIGRWDDSGRYILQIPFGDERELMMDILQWGDRAEILSPESLRERVVSVVEKMKNIYEK